MTFLIRQSSVKCLKQQMSAALVSSRPHNLFTLGFKASMPSSSPQPSLDIATQIRIDHDNIRDLFSRFKAVTSSGPDPKVESPEAVANTVVREVIVHCEAEEGVVYRKFDEVGMGGYAANDRGAHQR